MADPKTSLQSEGSLLVQLEQALKAFRIQAFSGMRMGTDFTLSSFLVTYLRMHARDCLIPEDHSAYC